MVKMLPVSGKSLGDTVLERGWATELTLMSKTQVPHYLIWCLCLEYLKALARLTIFSFKL